MTDVATGVRGDESELVARLSLEQKVRLLTGADSWVLHGESAVGLRPMVLSDGPAGVRGTRFDSANPSTSLPCPDRAWRDVGRASSSRSSTARARARGAVQRRRRDPRPDRQHRPHAAQRPRLRVLLRGPAADLPHRGRLRARRAVGGRGGDREALRGQRFGDRAPHLRRARHRAACCGSCTCRRSRRASPRRTSFLVMAAYNSVNGAFMTANAALLRDLLKTEWGFQGVVVSDWSATTHDRAERRRRARPRHAGAGWAVGRAARRGGARRHGARGRGRRQGVAAAGPGPAGRRPERRRLDGGAHARTTPALVDPQLLREATARSFVLLTNPTRAPAAGERQGRERSR